MAGVEGAQVTMAQRPQGKTRPTRRKAKKPEEITQELTEQYLDALGLPWFHMPAYILQSAFAYGQTPTGPQLGAMSRAAAIVRGLPDLLIWDGKGRCLPIELKTEAKASKLTAAQRLWRAAIGTVEARSFEAAKAAIDSWRAAPSDRREEVQPLNPLPNSPTPSTPGDPA
jgi:hypothetical protein